MSKLPVVALTLLTILPTGQNLVVAANGVFLATELLGRPTARSVTINALAQQDLEVYFEIGSSPGVYSHQTGVHSFRGREPIEVRIEELDPDQKYYYRMRYRLPGEQIFAEGIEHNFHTQRTRGSQFTFTVQADSHLGDPNFSGQLYLNTLENTLKDHPDFHIDLGDTFMSEKYASSYQEVVNQHLGQRAYLDQLCHSVPLFLTIGNHEGDLGWLLDGTPNNMAVWAANIRKMYYPNPVPDGFYTGSSTVEEFVGLRENYYAWEWGDALFVVLDPFTYTTSKPKQTHDNWDWTLGFSQYDWLKTTLEQSQTRFKFVFAHHLVGGGPFTNEGRGGIEAALYYEWGGSNLDGTWGFTEKRPGWDKPIHELLVDNRVTIYFHGHDHLFAKQDLDGIVYQEVPRPSHDNYKLPNYASDYGYVNGDILGNSGHLRVTVSPVETTVDYVRAYLAEDETSDQKNGEVAYSYTVVTACSSNLECDDGLFCNGAEFCSAGICQMGTDPCPGQSCSETLNQCSDHGTVVPPQPDLIFVQYVNGGSSAEPNTTRIILRDTNGESSSGEILFKGDDGSPSAVVIDGKPTHSVNFSLDPWGIFEVKTDGTGSLQSGVIEAFTDLEQDLRRSIAHTASSLEGTEVLQLGEHYVSVNKSIPGKAHQVYISVTSEENTGVAVYNPNQTNAVKIDLILLDSNGVERGRKQITLDPGRRTIGFIDQPAWFSEFFGLLVGEFKGTLNLVIDGEGEIATLGLLQDRKTSALITVPTIAKAFRPEP